MLAPIIAPIAKALPKQYRAKAQQWRSLQLSRVARRAIRSSRLLVTGDRVLKERAIVLCNHQSFWDLVVILALAAESQASVSFCLRGRVVSFLTARTWAAYNWTQPSTINISCRQDWIVVFPEQQRYSAVEAARSNGTRHLLRPNFDQVDQILAQVPVDAIYDWTLFYGSNVGSMGDPHLSEATYCSVTIQRFDAYDFKRKPARRQVRFLEALWARKNEHLSMLKRVLDSA